MTLTFVFKLLPTDWRGYTSMPDPGMLAIQVEPTHTYYHHIAWFQDNSVKKEYINNKVKTWVPIEINKL